MQNLRTGKWVQQVPFYSEKFLKGTLTEQDILDLQELFLTNGIHSLEVKNIRGGRKIITTFLDLLHCYYDIGCLTLIDLPHTSFVKNIYTILSNEGFIEKETLSNLDEFFFEKFYFDFMWVEVTPVLAAKTWFTEFKERMCAFKLDSHVPIVFLYYQNIETVI